MIKEQQYYHIIPSTSGIYNIYIIWANFIMIRWTVVRLFWDSYPSLSHHSSDHKFRSQWGRYDLAPRGNGPSGCIPVIQVIHWHGISPVTHWLNHLQYIHCFHLFPTPRRKVATKHYSRYRWALSPKKRSAWPPFVLKFRLQIQQMNMECPPLDIWRFPTMGVPQNGWFVVENPIKIDD